MEFACKLSGGVDKYRIDTRRFMSQFVQVGIGYI